MSLTYDGIVHRSLEEQVRYDAEQVQLLKQADVTINESLQTVNESLQTVNTEINGKLTKPTNPSAESAVTMLSDGTVGTKPLSEIGGGGRKVYRHHIKFDVTSTIQGYQNIDGLIFIDIYSSSSTAITLDTIPQLESGNAYIAWLYNPGYGTQGVVGVIFNPTHNEIEVYGAGSSSIEQFESLYYLFPYNAVTRFIDDYTEI